MPLSGSTPIDCPARCSYWVARDRAKAATRRRLRIVSPDRLFLATAEARDEEMADRIARHRADRGAGWSTREEPLELTAALRAEARGDRIVLIDCLTLWLSNLMSAGRPLTREIADLATKSAVSRGRS